MGPCALFIGLAASLVGLVLLRDKWVQHRWRVAARRLGMKFIAGNALGGDRILGEHGTYRIELDNGRRNQTSVILHTTHVPTNLHICARTSSYPVDDDPICTGDPDFDRLIRIAGPADELHARLTALTRRTLAGVLSVPSRATASTVVTGGRITYDAEYDVKTANRLRRIIRQLNAVADALAIDHSVLTQLRHNACNDDERLEVRLNALQVMITEYEDAPPTLAACRQLLKHSDPWLRLAAARHRRHKAENQDVLRSLIQDHSVPDDLRAIAIRTIETPSSGPLRPAAPRDPLEGLLADIVRDPSSAVRQAVAHTLAVRAQTEPTLLIRLAEDASPEVASTAIRGLARVFATPPPDLGAVLIRALTRPSYDVRIAAVAALGVVGQRPAIEPLRAVLKTSFFDQRLRQATRMAMRAIQVRSFETNGGHLSLVDNDARGGVSECETDALSEAPTSAR